MSFKHVVITAGPVYGRLDDNKLVSNRVRGIWALKFAGFLSARGHQVTLVLPDIMPKNSDLDLGSSGSSGVAITVRRHSGFDGYRDLCRELAVKADALVMAAAVVNWIPLAPIPGKMPTAGYKVGDTIEIPFYLAPRVIEEMKAENPKLTLIGCKMLINSTQDELVEAAYGVLLKAGCNAVVANDMGHGLRRKLIVNKDRSVQVFDNDFLGFYTEVASLIEDQHFRTERFTPNGGDLNLRLTCANAAGTFDRLVDQHRARFTPVEGGRVFGALAVGVPGQGWLVSPREKGGMFTSKDATLVTLVDHARLTVRVPEGWPKATLNAPLLIRFAAHFGHPRVLHFHEQIPGLPTLPYAQPGTVRDMNREFTEAHRRGFNIEGHGCVIPAMDA